MKQLSFEEVLEFQNCPMRWLLQYRYQSNYKIPIEELYVNTMHEVLYKACSKWFETALLEEDRVLKMWATDWLNAAMKNGITESEAEAKGIEGTDVLRKLVRTLIRTYVVVDGPFHWRYDITEIDTTVVGKTLCLVRSKRKTNGIYAYHILEVLPASYRFWSIQNAFRLLQVANHACREFLQGSTNGANTSTTLAIHPWRGSLVEIHGTIQERRSLDLLDTVVDQINALSIIPYPSESKCNDCPFVQVCDLRYISTNCKKRITETKKEIEERLCIIQQPNSYSTFQNMLERIMGFSFDRVTVRSRRKGTSDQ